MYYDLLNTHGVQSLEIVHEGVLEDEDALVLEQHPLRHLPLGEHWFCRLSVVSRSMDASWKQGPEVILE